MQETTSSQDKEGVDIVWKNGGNTKNAATSRSNSVHVATNSFECMGQGRSGR